jgi:hypothetical protein
VNEFADKHRAILESLNIRHDEALDTSETLTIRGQLRRCEARRWFLSGRLLIRQDPTYQSITLIPDVESQFNKARGLDADLDCRIDLELGDLLVTAARLGRGDVTELYGRAVLALERAAGRDAPALRTDTIRALADAYARRQSLLRRTKGSATGKSAEAI